MRGVAPATPRVVGLPDAKRHERPMTQPAPTSAATPAPPSSDEEGGQALVEFAMVIPIMLLIVFAVIEFGSAFWTYQQVSAAASEGARRAIVSRSSSSRNSVVETTVKAAAPGLEASKVSVSTTSTWTPGDPVTVRVSYPETITILGIELFNQDLVSRRTMRVVQ